MGNLLSFFIMSIQYEIYLRVYEAPVSRRSYWGQKTVLYMKKTFDKPVSKQSKVLPLMIDVSRSGKTFSQLVRYEILQNSYRQETNWNHDKCYPNGKTDHTNCKITKGPKIPTLLLQLMLKQNEDYQCYNCINYQHKRCKKKLMLGSNHQEPCNCNKCW